MTLVEAEGIENIVNPIMKKRELCAFMVVLDSTLVVFWGQWQWSRESEWNLGMQSSGGSVTLPSRQKMVLVPDIKRYWELKYQSDRKSLWWAEQIWTTTSPELTYMHPWGACKLLQFSITFYIPVLFFYEWSVCKNVSISSRNWLIVCWWYVFCCVYVPQGIRNNWSLSYRTVYSGFLGNRKSTVIAFYDFLTHVALQLSLAEPKSLLWNKGILYDGHMLTW